MSGRDILIKWLLVGPMLFFTIWRTYRAHLSKSAADVAFYLTLTLLTVHTLWRLE